MSAILPGATIGILGGGQLGRMTAMAARSLGYRVQVMDPDPSCPARFVVDACFEGAWDDAKAAANLARGCDVVTLEIEQLSLDTLARRAALCTCAARGSLASNHSGPHCAEGVACGASISLSAHSAPSGRSTICALRSMHSDTIASSRARAAVTTDAASFASLRVPARAPN